MGRLIREDDVMRMLTGVELNNGTITDAKIELRNVKTAYDISKVVAELEVMEEKRVRFAKQILDYWDKQGTQQTILFLKDIVENKSIEEQKQAVRSKNELSDHLRRIIEQNDERFSFE